MKGLGILSDFDLLEAYEKAVKLELDREFMLKPRTPVTSVAG